MSADEIISFLFSRLCNRLCHCIRRPTKLKSFCLKKDLQTLTRSKKNQKIFIMKTNDIKLGERSDQSPQNDAENGSNEKAQNQNPKIDIENGGNGKAQKDTFFKKFGGMLMALAASFFFSVSFLLVKILGNRGFKPYGCSVIFNLGVVIPCVIGIVLHEKGPKAHERSRIFAEIWPLSISNKSTALKILVVSIASNCRVFPLKNAKVKSSECEEMSK